MDYCGTNDDIPGQANDIRGSYVEKMKAFTRWLDTTGCRFRLFVGDTNGVRRYVVRRYSLTCGAYRPTHRSGPSRMPVTFADLMQAMEPAGTVVATRYHNVVCALMLSKPTISIGYGEKTRC